MVQITGEHRRPPPDASSTSRGSTSCAASPSTDGALVHRARSRPTPTSAARTLCREHLPALVEAAATIGAAQIQNRGTIGGNVANASPAGRHAAGAARDSTPRSSSAGRAASGRSPPATFWLAYRQDGARAGRADPARPHPAAGAAAQVALPQGRHAARPGDQQGRPGPRPWRRRSGGRRLARRAAGPRLGRGDADPGARRPSASLEGAAPTRGRRPTRAAAALARRDPPDRRRPLHRRLPAGRGRADPPPHDPRRRRLVSRCR